MYLAYKSVILPKWIIFKILSMVSPCYLLFYSKYSNFIKQIVGCQEFWDYRLRIEYSEFFHDKFENKYERYKRLYLGRAFEFELEYFYTWMLEFSDQESQDSEPNARNLEKLSNLAVKKFVLIRGDLVLVEILQRDDDDCGKFIFDGKKLCKLDGGIIPKSFGIFTEFPCDYYANMHSGLVSIDKNIVDISKSLVETIVMEESGIVLEYCSFVVNNKTFYICLVLNNARMDIKTAYQNVDTFIINREYDLPEPMNNKNTLFLCTEHNSFVWLE